jgi:predicted Na+-dependent transporter
MEIETLIKEIIKSIVITFFVTLILIAIRTIWASMNETTLPLIDSYLASLVVAGFILSDITENIRKKTFWKLKYTALNVVVISLLFYLILVAFY